MSEFDTWPHTILDSGDMRLTVLLPDRLQGYYRGPRFDWSGTVALAERNGHTFFGSWRPAPHRPRANDGAAGTAGEFGMGPLTRNPPPVGYNGAAVGEAFLKTGAGRIAKVREPAYSSGAAIELTREPGRRKRVLRARRRVRFRPPAGSDHGEGAARGREDLRERSSFSFPGVWIGPDYLSGTIRSIRPAAGRAGILGHRLLT